jgi:hypothetical protein
MKILRRRDDDDHFSGVQIESFGGDFDTAEAINRIEVVDDSIRFYPDKDDDDYYLDLSVHGQKLSELLHKLAKAAEKEEK